MSKNQSIKNKDSRTLFFLDDLLAGVGFRLVPMQEKISVVLLHTQMRIFLKI
jgi:hypothetical protein